MGVLLAIAARRRNALASASVALTAWTGAYADPAALAQSAAPEAARPTAAVADAASVYEVRAGDTLSEIAMRHAVGVARLVEANQLPDADRIGVGQHLRIPVAAGDDPAHALVAEAAELYRNARFDLALERTRQARALLDADAGSLAPEPRRALGARAAFISGCALAAFNENDRAAEAFSQVHALDPHFEPPAGWLSPRLERLYRARP
jgi:LysM repeat protein